MSEGLKVQVALDSRLIVENPTQIITTGSAQNLPRYVEATTVSGNQIQWNNILSLGNNVLIDPNWFVEYVVAITFDRTAGIVLPGVDNSGGAPVVLANPYALPNDPAKVPNVCFSQFPLTRISNNLALQFNNVETSINANQLLNLCREFILDDKQKREIASTCPAMNYTSANTVSSTNTLIVPNQPTTPYYASLGQSRASFLPESVGPAPAGGDMFIATYRLREPVFISPLVCGNSAGLGQVQSINLRYTLDSSKSGQGMLQSSGAYTTAQLSATITSASLYLDYLTIDPAKTGALPPVCYYNFEFPDFQQTLITGIPNVPTNTPITLTTQSQKLSTMPKYYYLKCSPDFGSLNSQNNLCGFVIDNIQITFGSLGQFLFDREQLWQCFKRNTGKLNLSYPQWVALGTPVVLQPAVDITSAGDLFQGKTNDSGIMWQNRITFNLSNYVSAGINYLATGAGVDVLKCYAYEAFVNSGSCQIGMGTCIFKNTTASEAEFVNAVHSADMVSDEALKTASGDSGGSFLSSMKGIFHGAKKAVATGAKFLQSPLAQKGLEYLSSQGAGMSAGALSHSLRRRK